ncbi:MAG TPA: hypothetical protein VGQ31_07210 [Candidatus Limnocylindrales bacterium]|nr:hypothetical protein [Candidatus Limnocylindrales bacterium]
MTGTKRSRDLTKRAKRMLGRDLSVIESLDDAKDPCAGCGEETASGSIFYSDRHLVERTDGQRSFLCSSCDSRIRATGKGRRLTDDEVRNTVENGSAAAYLWGSGGSIPL